jgi:hypothetical protein
MDPHLQLWQIVVSGVAIVLDPVTAVCITLWVQGRRESRTAKRQLFLSLIAQRKAFPPSTKLVESLNMIDVVFASDRRVLQAWHDYYHLLSQPPSQAREHKWLELLSDMATGLGYPNLRQTDLDKFYVPQGHIDQFQMQSALQTELLRVLKNTRSLAIQPKPPDVGNSPT